MEKLVYGISEGMQQDKENTFCPGCMHSTAHKIITEVLDELNMREKSVIVLPVGCAVNSHTYFNFDMIGCLHGRAGAVAVGLKHAQPDKLIFTYQGDGDAAGIGLNETFYAANRGDPITVIVINNQIYGMTGGQMSPCTLVGQKSTTTVKGRDPGKVGYPVHVPEILATLPATSYVARFALNNPKNILAAKSGIKKAFKLQMEKKAYSFIELLSACPTNWGISPELGPQWMEEKVFPVFPVGEFKVPEED
jgi:2-oxoglutarate ferredoxin oxidoreductase subunit beta